MTAVHTLTVPPSKAGERLDRFLSEALPGLSRSRFQELIGEGRVSVQGRAARASSRVRGGEEITVTVPPPRPLMLVPEDRPLKVLYQDPHLMVVEKPAGMVVHPSPGHSSGTLVHTLLSRAESLSGIGGVERPGIVHRLDRDTSGILVVAKDDAAHASLSAQLSAHKMERHYRGIVWGKPPRPAGTVRTTVGRHPAHRKKMAVLEDLPSRGAPPRPGKGRVAVTHYRCLESFGRFSLLEFRLGTGRTHQVRLHCAHLSCPIVGDDVYGRSREVRLGKGQGSPAVRVARFLLHACHLGLAHPLTGEWMEFDAPDPPEFGRFRSAVLAAER